MVPKYSMTGAEDTGAGEQGVAPDVLTQGRRRELFLNPPQEGKGGCWGARVCLLALGYHKPKQICTSTMMHKEASTLPSHRLGIYHLLPPGSPTGAAALMTQFALIS